MPNTALSKHTWNGDKCQHSLKCPLLARVKSLSFMLNAAAGEGKKILKAIKRLSKRCGGEKWEEAQMKFRFRMLKNDYFIQISWMIISFSVLLPPEPQPCSKSTQHFIRKPILCHKRPRVHNYGFLFPLA